MSPQDPATQLNTFKTYVTLIADSTPGSKLQLQIFDVFSGWIIHYFCVKIFAIIFVIWMLMCMWIFISCSTWEKTESCTRVERKFWGKSDFTTDFLSVLFTVIYIIIPPDIFPWTVPPTDVSPIHFASTGHSLQSCCQFVSVKQKSRPRHSFAVYFAPVTCLVYLFIRRLDLAFESFDAI